MSELARTNESTGMTAKQGFGEQSMARTAETQTAALSAKATAAVQARYVMAVQRPRDWFDVRVRLMRECERPRFAEAARYRKPIGRNETIDGPSVRFAEACLRYAGNMDSQVTTVFDDRARRILHVNVIDFETNASSSKDLIIEKTVERKNPKGRTVVGERPNSYGEVVYIVEATDDEVAIKEAALVSKLSRTLILKLIPADLVEECQEKCAEVIQKGASGDPVEASKRIIAAFSNLGVMPSSIAAYIGHSLETLNGNEVVALRSIYTAISEGHTTWREVVGDADEGEDPKAPKKGFKDRVKEAAAEAKKRKAATPAEPMAPASEPRRSEDADSPPPDDVVTGGEG